MTKRVKMSQEEIDSVLKDLPGWRLQDGKLHREFKFKDFVDAFGFMAKVALIAEKLNHHPNWSNVYSGVSIDLFTHDLDGVSYMDVEFARATNEVCR